MELNRTVTILVGIILAGGGILMFSGAFGQRRATPVRSFIGMVIAIVVVLIGVVILARPAMITGLFR